MERTIKLGVYGSMTIDAERGLESYAWPGGYPIVYYTDYSSAICAECAKEAELDYDLGCPNLDNRVTAADVLEGSAIDHGIVACDLCGKELIGLADDEVECTECGHIQAIEAGGSCENCAAKLPAGEM